MLEQRMKNLLGALPGDFEAALVQTDVNRFYLLDFDSGDAGTLLLLPHKNVFIIDSRYIEIAREEVKNAEVLLEADALAQVAEILQKEGVGRLLMESRVTVAQYEQVKAKLPGVELDAGPSLTTAIDAQRAIKDEEELGRMRRAQQVTDDCFTHILPFIKEGVREVDLMLEMEHFMRSHGAQKVAFDTICVAGAKSSLPHGEPGDNKVQKGDFITLDFGARVDGYCADMTRTVALGEPGDEKRTVYATVLRAHLAGIEAAKAGPRGCEVDKVARDIIREAGYGDYFGHGLGHAVGIEVHEDPRFSPKCNTPIRRGMMMTVEPGIYLPGQFGCRIEDCVQVTETGCEPLPASPKELIIL